MLEIYVGDWYQWSQELGNGCEWICTMLHGNSLVTVLNRTYKTKPAQRKQKKIRTAYCETCYIEHGSAFVIKCQDVKNKIGVNQYTMAFFSD